LIGFINGEGINASAGYPLRKRLF